MRYKRFIFIFLLFPLFAIAQSVVSGYLGKRLLGETHIAAVPSFFPWTGPTVDNQGGTQYGQGGNSKIGVSWRTGVKLQYIIGRRTSLFVGYEYLSTGLIFTAKTPPINPASTGVSGSIVADEHDIFMRLRCYAYEIGVENSIETGFFSPLGAYFRYSLQYEQLNGAVLQTTIRYQNGDAAGVRGTGLIAPRGWDVNLGLELGTRTIFYDRFTLTLGVKTHLPIMALFATPIDNSEEEYLIFTENYMAYNQYAFQRAARERLAIHSIFMLSVGVGVLLF